MLIGPVILRDNRLDWKMDSYHLVRKSNEKYPQLKQSGNSNRCELRTELNFAVGGMKKNPDLKYYCYGAQPKNSRSHYDIGKHISTGFAGFTDGPPVNEVCRPPPSDRSLRHKWATTFRSAYVDEDPNHTNGRKSKLKMAHKAQEADANSGLLRFRNGGGSRDRGMVHQ